MERQIEFTLTQDQLETLCKHFGVNPEEQEDFELCEMLDKLIDSVAKQQATLSKNKGVNEMEQYTLDRVLAKLALSSNHLDIWTLHDANNELIARATISNLIIMLGTRWFDYHVNETNSKNHYIKLAVQVF